MASIIHLLSKLCRQISRLVICLTAFLIINNDFRIDAQNTGPIAPEAVQFEPIDATDMVNLLTGDFTYVLPLLEVPGPAGGYPLALSYHAGVTMDQEASWVGLGWNINVGAINRSPNFMPDDWVEKEQFQFFWDDGGIIEQRSVGIFIPLPISIGLDFAWASHKGMGGYDAFSNNYWNAGAQVGFGVGGEGSGIRGGVSASVGSGGYSVGVFGSAKMGGVGVGGSVTGGSAGFTANVGLTNGISSVGVGISKDGAKASASILPVSLSLPQTNSITQNDYTRITKSWGFDLVVIKYSQKKTRYYLFKLKEFRGSGILGEPGGLKSGSTIDYINDANIIDFGNYRNSFLVPATDVYNVLGQGIGGNIEPLFSHKLTLGREKIDIDSDNQKYIEYVTPYLSSENKRGDNHFEFAGEHAAYSKVKEGSFNTNNIYKLDDINDNAGGFISGLNNPKNYKYSDLKATMGRTGNIVTYYQNNEIAVNLAECISKGFKETESIVGSRIDNDLFDPNGIGAFSITTADGKTYHYSLPVYQFEKFDEVRPESDFDDFTLNVSPHKYATSWLLTAVTGPDYVDNNMDGMVNIGDCGYWVSFQYGKWTDGYMWQSPYFIGEKRIYNNGSVMLPRSWGRKQIYYLDAVTTASHTAYFFKSQREDGESRSTDDYERDNYDISPSYAVRSPLRPTTNYRTYNTNRLDMFTCNETNVEKEKDKDLYVATFGYHCDVPYMVKPLKLDKIILVNNNERTNISNPTHSNNPQGSIYIKKVDVRLEFPYGNANRKYLSNYVETESFNAYSASPILLTQAS